MPGKVQLTSIWNNLKEFELEPIRKEALRPLSIALVGAPGSERQRLAEQLLTDTSHAASPAQESSPRSFRQAGADGQVPLLVLDLDPAVQVGEVDLIIVLLDAAESNFGMAQSLVRSLAQASKKVIVFCNTLDANRGHEILSAGAPWHASAALVGWVDDLPGLLESLVPAVLNLLPDQHLALGRHFPLFRIPIARQLISETCFSNGAYALGSGLAEVVPVLNLPMNITDIIVLTKAQAFLAYRLGLLLGFNTNWQDYLAEFGSVVGSGFIWRQLARSLVGLIPVWGIVPKVAIAYAGTYVVGHTILQWYLTGRHLNPRQVRDLYRQALAQGKVNAQKLLKRAPRPRLPRLAARNRKPTPALPAPQEIPLPEQAQQVCPACERLSAAEARFCQYCGHEFSSAQPAP